MSNIHTLGDLRAKEFTSANPIPPAPPATNDSSAAPPAPASKGRTIKTSLMSGASGLTLSGGTLTNVGGAVYRKRPAGIAAPSLPEPLLEEPEDETIIAEMLDNVDNLTVLDGVEVDNFGTELLAGQRPKKGQNIHLRLLEKVKDSEIKGGKLTNAATVIYIDEVIAKEKV